MKTLICILNMLLLSLVISAQDIDYAEYFIDADPGYGKATTLNISSPASELTLNFDVNTSSLSNGWHFIGIRAKNVSGKWGLNCNRIFYLIKISSGNYSKISKAEYFIDTDPGFGKANQIAFNSPDFDLTLAAIADLTVLSNGIHYLGIRSADANGRWGIQTNRIFYYFKLSALSSKVAKAEYFIDTDPGFGKAKQFTIASANNELTLNITDDLAGMEQGMHQIVIRAQDLNGRWGTSVQRIFYFLKKPLASLANISQIEYFYDTDPGYGKGTSVALGSPGKDVTINFNANLAGLTPGNHMVFVRSKNAINQWGQVYAEAFSYTITGLGNEELVSLFKVYPNPNHGDFRVQFPENQIETLKVRIIDMAGRVIKEKLVLGKSEAFSLEISKGIYLIQVEKGNKVFSQKLCIE